MEQFSRQELNLICIYDPGSRGGLISEITSIPTGVDVYPTTLTWVGVGLAAVVVIVSLNAQKKAKKARRSSCKTFCHQAFPILRIANFAPVML